jgi:hypothetical protein
MTSIFPPQSINDFPDLWFFDHNDSPLLNYPENRMPETGSGAGFSASFKKKPGR